MPTASRPVQASGSVPCDILAHEAQSGTAAPAARSLPLQGLTRSGAYAVVGQEVLGAVIPDVHLNDLAGAHDKAIEVAISLEGSAVGPFAVKRAEVVDDGLAGAGHDVAAF